MDTVAHYIETVEFGGAERALLTLAAGQEPRGWHPVLLHPPGALRFRGFALADGLEAVEVPPFGSPLGIRTFRALVDFLRERRVRLFHAHLAWPGRCLRAILAARVAGVEAVVLTLQLAPPVIPRRTALRHCAGAILVDRQIAVSEDLAHTVRSACPRSSSTIRVVHNSAPPAAFVRIPERRSPVAALTGQRPVVLTVARLDGQKGLPYLLEAATHLPHVTFLVAGEGHHRARLEDHARVLDVADRVHFLGYREDVADLLAACDVFVLSSLYEGLSLAVLEAMTAGKPVVASAVGGMAEAVVDGVTGLLVPPANARALAGAVQRVLSDPALARRLAEAGQVRARAQFTADRMIDRTTAVYDEALRARHRWHWRPSRPKKSAIVS